MHERSLPPAEVPPAAAPSHVSSSGGRSVLDDPRAMQILSTEHWSLLASRSLAYNESFTRAGMLVTAVTGTIVALGFVAQAIGFGPDFRWLALLLLGLDLVLGIGTIIRAGETDDQDFRAIQAMNRIRHAYLEMVPGLAPYFSTSPHDDMRGVVATYWAVPSSPAFLPNVTHGLGTLGAAVAFIVALLTGAIAGLIALQLGATGPATAAAGVLVFVLCMLAEFALGYRRIQALDARFEVRFPSPSSGPADPGGSG